MTDRQQRILQMFHQLEREHRRRPSYVEIAQETGLPYATIKLELARLVKAGRLRQYDCYVDTRLYNGPMSGNMSANSFGFTLHGCPYRGTTTCYDCPFEPMIVCDYKCQFCPEQTVCKCGHDQTARLKGWGII